MNSASLSSSVSVSRSGMTYLQRVLYAGMFISVNPMRVSITCLGNAGLCSHSDCPHPHRVLPLSATCSDVPVRVPLCGCGAAPTLSASDERTIFVRFQALAAYFPLMFHCAIFGGRSWSTPGRRGSGFIDRVVGSTCRCLMWVLSVLDSF